MRAEQQREGSQYGALIKKFIQEGEIVPMEITVGLLQKAMQENIRRDKTKFLIDGFPRKMDQALAFETNVFHTRNSFDDRSARVSLFFTLKDLRKSW